MSVLRGNLFSCPVPSFVADNDPDDRSYECGSHSLWIAAVIAIVAAGFGLIWLRLVPHDQPIPPASADEDTPGTAGTPTLTPANLRGPPQTQTRLTQLLGRCSAVVSVVWIAVLLPGYATGPSVLSCRYGWIVTAAYLDPGPGSDHAWGWIVGLAGGLVGASVLTGGLVWCGTRGGAVAVCPRLSVPRHPTTGGPSTGSRTTSWVRFAAAMAWVVLSTVVAVGVSVGFTLVEHSPSLSSTVKWVFVVLFAGVHELLDGWAGPRLVHRVLALLSPPKQPAGSTARAFRWVVALELINSTVAPLVGFVVASEQCLAPLLFEPAEPDVVSVPTPFCATTTAFLNGTSICTQTGVSLTTATFTPPFDFDGQQCTSSVITLFTPAFLVVFGIRIMLLYQGHRWLQRRTPAGFPAMLAGSSPPDVPLAVGAATDGEHRRSVSLPSLPGRQQAEVMESDVDSATIPADLGGYPPRDTGAELVEQHQQTPPLVASVLDVEHDSFAINCIAIALCPGMLSPLVAVAASLCLAARWWMHTVFGSAPAARHTRDTHNGDQELRLPVECVGFVLLVQTVYLLLFMYTNGFGTVGLVVAVLNWAGYATAVAVARCRYGTAPLCSSDGRVDEWSGSNYGVRQSQQTSIASVRFSDAPRPQQDALAELLLPHEP